MPANSFSFSFMVTEFVEVWFRIVCLLDAKKVEKLHGEGYFLAFSASESLLQLSHAVQQFGKSWAGAVNHGIAHVLIVFLPIISILFGRDETDSIANITIVIYPVNGSEHLPVMANALPKCVIMNGGKCKVFVHHPIDVIQMP